MKLKIYLLLKEKEDEIGLLEKTDGNSDEIRIGEVDEDSQKK